MEKELEQQKKELEKEREERMRDEDWLRNIELPDVARNDGNKIEECLKQVPRVARYKRNAYGVTIDERAVQKEKDATEKEIQEKEKAEKK